MIDAETLSRALHIPRERAEHWEPHLNAAMTEFEIDTPERMAAFLAQCAHESAFLTRWVENLNYSTATRLVEVFGAPRFVGPRLPGESNEAHKARAREAAAPFARNPEGLAEFVYGGRSDLGNVESGDGARFIGRGLIQLTGRRNYERASIGLEIDYLNEPELLTEESHAAMASAFWWADQRWRGITLNDMADEGMIDSISGMVNRGNPDKIAIGADERRRIYHDCLDVLTA